MYRTRSTRQPQTRPARKAPPPQYKPKLGDLVYVRWIDARGCPMGWAIRDELDSKPVEIESVGWVETVGDDYLCVAPHVGGAPTIIMGHVTVPMVCVKALRLMRPATSSFSASGDSGAASALRPQPSSLPASISYRGASRSQLSRRASKSSRP